MAPTGADIAKRGRNVRLELLDGFRLHVDGDDVHPLAGAQRLLAYLALRGPAARVVTAGTLWAGVPEEHALASLRTTMWRCNRILRGLVAVKQTQLALADFVQVDVAELVNGAALVLAGPARDGAARDGAARDSAARVGHGGNPYLPALRGGELLPGWYEDWVNFERERLRHLRLHALEAAAGRLAANGDYAASLEFALEAVRSGPLRESARRAVIVVHLAENNVSEALREYERFRALLVDQLGIEPSAHLTNLVYAGRGAARRMTAVTRLERTA